MERSSVSTGVRKPGNKGNTKKKTASAVSTHDLTQLGLDLHKMEKASRAIRRSGVKLFSLPGGHGDLNMLVSEIKDIRHSAKLLMNAQHLASQDMMRWAAHEENRAIQDVISQVAELNLLWTEVQKLFVEHLKEYRHMFEQVLEGEKRVTEAKTNLNYCEEKESKVKKEFKRISKRATGSELRIFETKVSVAEKAREMAQLELTERLRENEAIKLIQMKSGMMKVSEAYIEMSSKCNVLFSAQKEVVHQLPDVHRQELESIKYTGAGTTRFIVQQARERVEKYSQIDTQEPPPPYTPPESESSVDKGTPQPAPRRSCGRESSSSPGGSNVTPPYPTNEMVVTHKTRVKMADASHVDMDSKCHGPPIVRDDYLPGDEADDGLKASGGASLYPPLPVDTEPTEKGKPVPVPRPRHSHCGDIDKDLPVDKTKTAGEVPADITETVDGVSIETTKNGDKVAIDKTKTADEVLIDKAKTVDDAPNDKAKFGNDVTAYKAKSVDDVTADKVTDNIVVQESSLGNTGTDDSQEKTDIKQGTTDADGKGGEGDCTTHSNNEDSNIEINDVNANDKSDLANESSVFSEENAGMKQVDKGMIESNSDMPKESNDKLQEGFEKASKVD